MLLYSSGPQCASDIFENIIRYFSFFQEHVPSSGEYHNENAELFSICCDVCYVNMPTTPIEGIPQCTTTFFVLHFKNCTTVRRDFGSFQRLNGGIKKQFESNNKLMFVVLLEYVKVVRQSSCHVGCGGYKRLMGESTSNSDKTHQKLLQDDVIFKVGQEWATAAKAPREESATKWPQVSQIARIYVPLIYNDGPRWHARDIDDHFTLHHDTEVQHVFSQQWRDFCCKRPHKYLNVLEVKLKESKPTKHHKNFDTQFVYLERVFGYSQMHRYSGIMSSFASAFMPYAPCYSLVKVDS
jgi:hypothetical protein